MVRIDLNEYRSQGSKVFSGRDRGETVRRAVGLDSIDQRQEDVQVLIPMDVYSINTSFFLGFLGPSVRRAGSVPEFKRRFTFLCPEYIEEDINTGIEDALREGSALRKHG